jgi:hypothetical protein
VPRSSLQQDCCGVFLHRRLPPIPLRCVSGGIGSPMSVVSMEEHDPLAAAKHALEEAKKARADLCERVEAARCMGAKVLLTLRVVKDLDREGTSSSEGKNSN